MRGAIIGDIVGSRFEWDPYKKTDFDLFGGDGLTEYKCSFTDDTVMTVAVAAALLAADPSDGEAFKGELVRCMHRYARPYLYEVGFGVRQYEWLKYEKTEPYNSFGNGSAMRVSPAAWYAESLEDALRIARLTAEVTHNHPEGIKGAQAVAACIWLGRSGAGKEEIREFVIDRYYPQLDYLSLDALRPTYDFDVTCQGSVPESIEAFLESGGFEDSLKLAVSMGGDSDTMADMAGAIAEAHYGIPTCCWETASACLNQELLEVVNEFCKRYCPDTLV